MSPKKPVPRLLASELEILEMLWRTERVTLIEAQRALDCSDGYTTIQTRLNRMVKKGLVKRSRSKPAKYSAAIQPEAVTSGDLDLLLDKVSRGKVVPLVAHLVRERSLTDAEVAELKQLIADAEQRASSSPNQEGAR
ncbi:MAG: BlaI/MecI/CopY family transcriptional regulator [Planctomycetaceae bacterium]|nr:BlaI/MecI/CopY family transcriptional regulator [Planctomycetaceae bacterium]